MDLVRDLLDKQVVDRHGRPLGRVDQIILELGDGGQPRIAAIEIGLVSIAGRLHPFLGRCARALETMLDIDRERPVRVPFSAIIDFDYQVKLDLAATDTHVLAFEQLTQRIVRAIPGAR